MYEHQTTTNNNLKMKSTNNDWRKREIDKHNLKREIDNYYKYTQEVH
jgi:hypothetical protein